MLVIAALFPIFIALLLMCRFKISPGKAMPTAWLFALLIALVLWKMKFTVLIAASIQGVFKSLDIIFIIFGALLLLNVMQKSGAMQSIKQTFSNISKDRRIQLLVIAWLFSGFIEGASGFGAAPALAAPLLAGLGFPPLIAVSVSLICNTLPVPFGAVGIPVQTAVFTLSRQLAQAGIPLETFNADLLDKLTLISGCSGVILPWSAITMMIMLDGGKRKLRSIIEIMPLSIFSAAAYIIPWRITAIMLGPELAAMMGAVFGLPLTLLCVRFKIMVPKYVWDFSGSPAPEMPKLPQETTAAPSSIPAYAAWIPYAALALILLILRMPGSCFKGFLNSHPLILPEMFGVARSGASWNILNNPGLIPIAIIAAASAFCWHIPVKQQWQILKDTTRQISMSAIAIAASVAIVQIMVFSADCNEADLPGMLDCIAIAAAGAMGKAYLVSAPFIGILGTFFTGSCTVSNILFAPLQYNTAAMLDLPTTLTIAVQNIGGGLGSMIRLSGVIAACATVNAAGKEGKIILLNTIPVILMGLLTVVCAYIYIYR